MGKRWRAPKKRNEKAWKRIEAGEINWEDTYVARRYLRVPSAFSRRGYGYLTYASKRHKNGSVLDQPVVLKEPDPKRKRSY